MKNDSIDYAIFYYKQNGPEGRLAEAYNYKAMTLYFDQGKKEKAIEIKNAIGEIGKIFSDAEQTPQN